jgi:hypothetical protein
MAAKCSSVCARSRWFRSFDDRSIAYSPSAGDEEDSDHEERLQLHPPVHRDEQNSREKGRADCGSAEPWVIDKMRHA